MTSAAELEHAVAMALCEADDGGNTEMIFAATEHKGDCTNDCHTCSLCQIESYHDLARAAIAAVREVLQEPTLEMIEAGNKQQFARAMWLDDEATPMWQAMLAASPIGEREEPK